MKRKSSKRPRWGSLSEIKGIKRIGDSAYKSAPLRLRKLASWRRLHMKRGHPPVRRQARGIGVKPSSNMLLSQMRTALKRLRLD